MPCPNQRVVYTSNCPNRTVVTTVPVRTVGTVGTVGFAGGMSAVGGSSGYSSYSYCSSSSSSSGRSAGCSSKVMSSSTMLPVHGAVYTERVVSSPAIATQTIRTTQLAPGFTNTTLVGPSLLNDPFFHTSGGAAKSGGSYSYSYSSSSRSGF